MIDLHLHSTASDGLLEPAQLMEKLCGLGFHTVALTDHDTQSGVASAQERARGLGMTFIPGVEISAGGCPETHILGYGVEAGAKQMEELLTRMQRARLVRMENFISLLNANGVRVTMDDVLCDGVNETTVGRPHLGRALVRLGYAADLREAFSRYLVQGCPAYVQREKVCVSETVRVIAASGGVAVLAHPALLRLDWRAFENMLIYCKKIGVSGVECYHPAHTAQQAAAYRAAAQRYGFLLTGGSDYHGCSANESKPRSIPGEGLETFYDADEHAVLLQEAIERHRRGM